MIRDPSRQLARIVLLMIGAPADSRVLSIQERRIERRGATPPSTSG